MSTDKQVIVAAACVSRMPRGISELGGYPTDGLDNYDSIQPLQDYRCNLNAITRDVESYGDLILPICEELVKLKDKLNSLKYFNQDTRKAKRANKKVDSTRKLLVRKVKIVVYNWLWSDPDKSNYANIDDVYTSVQELLSNIRDIPGVKDLVINKGRYIELILDMDLPTETLITKEEHGPDRVYMLNNTAEIYEAIKTITTSIDFGDKEDE